MTSSSDFAVLLVFAFVAGQTFARHSSNEIEQPEFESLSHEQESNMLRGLLQDDPPTYPPPPVVTANVTNDNPLGGAGDTAQSVVSRSKLILPDTANKEAAAQALVNGVGNNGVIEKRKVGNGFQTLSKSYELGEAMLNDALAGAPESTAGRLQFLADADNNIDMVLTLFYPEDVSEGAMEQDAAQGAALVNQRRESGTYDAAFVSAGQEAGFDGAAVTVESFVVESGAPSLRASLMGMCISVGAILLFALQ
uniref:Uncharacterized protein n=1 Tax=Dunaliella tertiolecta TaxID=3047 RepID=A0A7S3RB38_DUNTE